MYHRANAAHRVIQFNMSVGVPSQCCNTLAGFYFKAFQRMRKLAGAFITVTVSVAMNVAFKPPRHNFLLWVSTHSMTQQINNHQLTILNVTLYMRCGA